MRRFIYLIFLLLVAWTLLSCAPNPTPPPEEQVVVKILGVRWECTTTFVKNENSTQIKKIENYGPKGKEVTCLDPKHGVVKDYDISYFFKWYAGKLEREGKTYINEDDFNKFKKGEEYLGYLCPSQIVENEEVWCFTKQVK